MTLVRAVIRVLALPLLVVSLGAVLASAGATLGCDCQAYVQAARRLLDGAPLYDRSVDLAGGFAIYLYPPPFALAFVPFALLPEMVGTWVWTALLVGCLLGAVALLPVRREIRWLVLLLAAVDWPVLYGVKLGQVGPLLLLLFALGWRWLDRDRALGASAAAGAIVKVQPGLLIGWAWLMGRRRAAGTGIAIVVLAAGVATLATGPGAWFDYLALIGRVSSPITTPHNFTPGAIAWQAGVPETLAAVIQAAAMLGTALAVLAAIRWTSGEVSYLATVVATQLLSPLLWDHYAIVLLLPVAWLLERRQWWAAAIPLATSLPLVMITPAFTYPIVFALGLLGPMAVARFADNPRIEAPATLRLSGHP